MSEYKNPAYGFDPKKTEDENLQALLLSSDFPVEGIEEVTLSEISQPDTDGFSSVTITIPNEEHPAYERMGKVLTDVFSFKRSRPMTLESKAVYLAESKSGTPTIYVSANGYELNGMSAVKAEEQRLGLPVLIPTTGATVEEKSKNLKTMKLNLVVKADPDSKVLAGEVLLPMDLVLDWEHTVTIYMGKVDAYHNPYTVDQVTGNLQPLKLSEQPMDKEGIVKLGGAVNGRFDYGTFINYTKYQNADLKANLGAFLVAKNMGVPGGASGITVAEPKPINDGSSFKKRTEITFKAAVSDLETYGVRGGIAYTILGRELLPSIVEGRFSNPAQVSLEQRKVNDSKYVVPVELNAIPTLVATEATVDMGLGTVGFDFTSHEFGSQEEASDYVVAHMSEIVALNTSYKPTIHSDNGLVFTGLDGVGEFTVDAANSNTALTGFASDILKMSLVGSFKMNYRVKVKATTSVVLDLNGFED